MMEDTTKTATTGNSGKGVRSDCKVSITLTETGGNIINIQSKVKTLYGKSINELILRFLAFYNIDNSVIEIEDTGALDFVIMARLEAALKKLVQSDKEFLPEMLPQNHYSTEKDRNRFSRLYLPGNTPSLMINAGIHNPDGIILDLEDAVAPMKKDEARFLVRNALRAIDFYGAERMVRINQVPAGLIDLDFVIPHNVNIILVPKCESPEQIKSVNDKINSLKKLHNIDSQIWLMPIIESSTGVIRAYDIASCASNITSLAIGLEDYTADIGAKRTNEGTESFYARSVVVNAAKAVQIQPIDSVFSDVADMEGLKQNVIRSKALGFEGMGCIHPRQIKIIKEYFGPDDDEIAKAKKIVNAFIEATEKGLGVVSLGTKMIDPPVVKRAQRAIDIAISIGKISKNWREEENGN